MGIIYIPMTRGFIYLAAVLDWFIRRVVAWRVSITLEAVFVFRQHRRRLRATVRPRSSILIRVARPSCLPETAFAHAERTLVLSV
ncbi:hypothetical protein SAMN04488238_10250 [Roseicitreum antarcticum]|uniref:Integrase core domain-containing protein n=1 Tax=Roseicitreum antarcticum TaxID=564137 RepID=A0A1H2TGA1_9RHOB|nr:hypothetical protein SAMN04488238_10250 [Roseicitreum antarcticum]